MYSYGITQQGIYHIKNDIVCQDAHTIARVQENVIVAAVADGLGSELYSDIASRIASDLAVKKCVEFLETSDEKTDEEIITTIRDAFQQAQLEIEAVAHANNHEVDQYDTTLSVSVLIDDCLYYGHAGDSGIIAFTTDGLFKKVTEQQRDDYGCVFPLCFPEKWCFGKFKDKVASVLLATDGILELFFPVYLRNQTISIYTALARYFMDNQLLTIDSRGEDEVRQQMDDFLNSFSEEQVNDDKTLVVLVNTDIEVNRQEDSYYQEPNWPELIEQYRIAWEKEAYPSLQEEG